MLFEGSNYEVIHFREIRKIIFFSKNNTQVLGHHVSMLIHLIFGRLAILWFAFIACSLTFSLLIAYLILALTTCNVQNNVLLWTGLKARDIMHRYFASR